MVVEEAKNVEELFNLVQAEGIRASVCVCASRTRLCHQSTLVAMAPKTYFITIARPSPEVDWGFRLAEVAHQRLETALVVQNVSPLPASTA